MPKQRAARPDADVPPPSIEERAEAAGVVTQASTRGLTSEQARANIEAQYRSLTPEIKEAIRHARKTERKSYRVIQREFGVMNPVVSRVLNEPPNVDQQLNHILADADPAQRSAFEAQIQDWAKAPAITFAAIVRRYVLQDVPMTIQAVSFADAEATVTKMDGVVKLVSLTVEEEDEHVSCSQPAGH